MHILTNDLAIKYLLMIYEAEVIFHNIRAVVFIPGESEITE